MLKCEGDIIKRAVVLLSFSDRCALEKSIINGRKYTLSDREKQRKSIILWLQRMNYGDSISKEENTIFEERVDLKSIEILRLQSNYECLEPLLWSLGLIEKLSEYDDYVLTDFHPILEIGKSHSFEKLLDKVHLINEDIIQKQREISMLWYWRCIEGKKRKNYLELIQRVFGFDYGELIKDYDYFDVVQGDFCVHGKPFYQLSNSEIRKITIIAERRCYAYEWLCTNSEWDEVCLVC